MSLDARIRKGSLTSPAKKRRLKPYCDFECRMTKNGTAAALVGSIMVVCIIAATVSYYRAFLQDRTVLIEYRPSNKVFWFATSLPAVLSTALFTSGLGFRKKRRWGRLGANACLYPLPAGPRMEHPFSAVAHSPHGRALQVS